jgi:cellulose biosynthesis protein BcsQ
LRSIAVYSLKGGVGKTTLAVQLGLAAATRSSRRTLLWDLDAQGAASFLLGADGRGKRDAQAVFLKDVEPSRLIQPTATDRLELLPADASLRSLDRLLHELDKKKRLAKLMAALGEKYERVILDAPPGLTETSEQVLRAADLIVVPVIPSPLSQRALEEVRSHLSRHRLKHGPILPVFNLVDRRRGLHRAALAEQPDWPIVPCASALEAMTTNPGKVAPMSPRSAAGAALTDLWTLVERRLNGR